MRLVPRGKWSICLRLLSLCTRAHTCSIEGARPLCSEYNAVTISINQRSASWGMKTLEWFGWVFKCPFSPRSRDQQLLQILNSTSPPSGSRHRSTRRLQNVALESVKSHHRRKIMREREKYTGKGLKIADGLRFYSPQHITAVFKKTRPHVPNIRSLILYFI